MYHREDDNDDDDDDGYFNDPANYDDDDDDDDDVAWINDISAKRGDTIGNKMRRARAILWNDAPDGTRVDGDVYPTDLRDDDVNDYDDDDNHDDNDDNRGVENGDGSATYVLQSNLALRKASGPRKRRKTQDETKETVDVDDNGVNGVNGAVDGDAFVSKTTTTTRISAAGDDAEAVSAFHEDDVARVEGQAPDSRRVDGGFVSRHRGRKPRDVHWESGSKPFGKCQWTHRIVARVRIILRVVVTCECVCTSAVLIRLSNYNI